MTAVLRDAVLRLRRIHAWNLLESPPGARSPYRLALCHARSGETAKDALLGNETYEIVLRRAPGTTPRKQQQYAYVFAVDSHGRSTLPFPEGGSVENRVPRSLPGPREIRLGNGTVFVVGPPYGVDTFFLLTTDEALPNPWVLEWDGVRTRSPELLTPLEQLLLLTHSGTRTASPVTPATWSLERVVLESVPATRPSRTHRAPTSALPRELTR